MAWSLSWAATPTAAAIASRPVRAFRWHRTRKLAAVVLASKGGDYRGGGGGGGDSGAVRITTSTLLRSCAAYVGIWAVAVEAGGAIAISQQAETLPSLAAIGASFVRACAFVALVAVPEVTSSWPAAAPTPLLFPVRADAVVRGAALGAITALGSALVLVESSATTITTTGTPTSSKIAQLGGGADSSAVAIVCVFLSAALFAPAAEELFFRGPLYCGLKAAADRDVNPWVARGVSAAVFGLWHRVGDPSVPNAAIAQLTLLGFMCTVAADPPSLDREAGSAGAEVESENNQDEGEVDDRGASRDSRNGNESFVAAAVCHGTYNAFVLVSQILFASVRPGGGS